MCSVINYLCKYGLFVVFVSVTLGVAQAESLRSGLVRVEGVAEILQGDLSLAKQKALSDALHHASLVLGMHVMAAENISSADMVLRSQQVRPVQKISGFSILEEWASGEIYHVVISVDEVLDESLQEKMSRIHSVKKKVAFVQFDAVNTAQWPDMRDIYSELPKDILNRLETSGGILAQYVNGVLPRNSEASQRDIVMQIAKKTGSQFVVSGLILDAGKHVDEGFIESIIGAEKRLFKVEIVMHDGLTGAKLASHSFEALIDNSIDSGVSKHFGGRAFFSTESGHALNSLIDIATKDVRAVLSCVPFAAQVVRVEGNNVYLDAGAVSMLKVGDQLIIYSSEFNLPVVTLGGAMLGMSEHPSSTVTLVKTQPLFSIGELKDDAKKLGVKPGSFARFEFSEKGLYSTCPQ